MPSYSSKTLQKKLGYQSAMNVCVINAYANYWQDIGALPDDVNVNNQLNSHYQLIHYFSKKWSELNTIFPQLIEHLAPGGMIWISWPKKAAKIPTDLNENLIRELGLALGIVDVKVCAVNEIWSGLKFLRRKQLQSKISVL